MASSETTKVEKYKVPLLGSLAALIHSHAALFLPGDPAHHYQCLSPGGGKETLWVPPPLPWGPGPGQGYKGDFPCCTYVSTTLLLQLGWLWGYCQGKAVGLLAPLAFMDKTSN